MADSKLKIKVTSSSQGVLIHSNPEIEVIVVNEASDGSNLILTSNNEREYIIPKGVEKMTGNSQFPIILSEVAPIEFDVTKLNNNGIITQFFKGVSVTNKTTEDIYVGDTPASLASLSNDGIFPTPDNPTTKCVISSENLIVPYQEPVRPPIPTPAHYSDVKITNTGDYRIRVNANNQFDCNIINNTATDIQDALTTDTTTAETFTNGGAKVITNDHYFAKDSNKLFVSYQEPTRPPIPTPAHYSDIELHKINDYTVYVTASSSEDVNVTNNLGVNITPRNSNGDNLNALNDKTSAVYTNDAVFSSDHFMSYQEPTRPPIPTPDNYSYLQIDSINSDISVTATTDFDCKVFNNSGADIKVGNDTLANQANTVLTENKTIALS